MALSPLYGSLIPTAAKQTGTSNYLDFTSGAGNDFSQQYLPEIYEAEVERYGNRTLSGFLQMVGAEMPMSSDQVIWSEQNRLHISYNACTIAANDSATVIIGDNATGGSSIVGGTGKHHAIRKNALIVVLDPDTGTEQKAFVSAVTGTTVEAHPFGSATWAAALVSADALKVFVFGSEFGKGTSGMEGSVDPEFTQFNNSPIIIKDHYGINGSDTAQIGWVEVATEDGTSGYLWYLKAESETRLRYQDYLEMTMVEAEKADSATDTTGSISAYKQNVKGTEGLFAALNKRGNVYSAFPATLGSFDEILKNLDGQGAIEENMLFLDRTTNLAFDDMLAGLNGGNAGAGSAYGIFENSEEMALNLGFTGFRRGSYDFYKTDWKYLNDASTRGFDSGYNAAGEDSIDGVLIPAGTSTVYDQILGTNIRRPFLHVRYRASEADDRRLKTWITGSVGGAFTSSDDVMNVHFLSERCLCVQGANNFVLLKK
mgnify:FL=1